MAFSGSIDADLHRVPYSTRAMRDVSSVVSVHSDRIFADEA